MSIDSDRDQVLDLTQRLVIAAAGGDWDTYAELCDPSLTCFEPEALGNLVDGLDFHHYYFKLPGGGSSPVQTTIVSPHIRIMGDVAVVAYVRLTQKIGGNGAPVTTAMEETRIWQRRGPSWKHVHFHRSPTRY
jgi:ketosteroid isomerase-like protein